MLVYVRQMKTEDFWFSNVSGVALHMPKPFEAVSCK